MTLITVIIQSLEITTLGFGIPAGIIIGFLYFHIRNQDKNNKMVDSRS